MDTRVNYTLVGIFVFVLGFLLLSFLLWMAKYGLQEKQFESYTILVQEGVSGLNIESPVKFRGVEVGNVSEIAIDPNNSEIIRVSIEVDPGTPIKQDSIAVLTAQGITGLSYIELKGGSNTSPRLTVGGTITAGKSLFDKIEYSATSVGDGLVHTLSRVDALLNDKNIQHISETLQHINQLSAILANRVPQVLNAENRENIRLTLANSARTSQILADTVEQELPQVLNAENSRNIRVTLASLANVSQNLARDSQKVGMVLEQTIALEKAAQQTLSDYSQLSAAIQERIERGEFDLRQMTEHHLESLNNLLVELQMLSHQTNEVLQQLKRSPSDLLFKQEVVKPGPGE